MSSVVARLTRDGDLKLYGELLSRIPPVRNGLVASFPFDGCLYGDLWTDGWSSSVVADGHIHDCTYTKVSLIAGMKLNFSGWFKSKNLDGYVTFYCYHLINGNWSYQGVDIQNSFKNDEWVYIERELIIGGTQSDVQSNWLQGISIRDSCKTGSLEWKKCKCWIEASSDNCTLTNNGIYIEESTANLIPSKDLSDFHAYSSSKPNVYAVKTLDGWYRVPLTGYYELLMDKQYSIVAGGTYTESFLFRTNSTNPNDIRISFFSPTTSHHTVVPTVRNLGNNTYYCTATYTVGSNETVLRAIDIQVNGMNGTFFDIKNAQLEAKAFSTSYVNGSRGNGYLRIPNSNLINPTEGTIVLDYYVNNNYPQGYSRIFEAGIYSSDNTKDWFALGRSVPWDVNTFRFYIIDGSTKVMSGPYYGGLNNRIGHWLRAVFGYSASKKTIRCYLYDLTTKEILLDSTNAMNFDGFSDLYTTNTSIGLCSTSGIQNSAIKNLSFYNRLLSDGEITKVARNKFSLTSDGDICGVEIAERGLNVPSDAYYFPLDFEASDSTKSILATVSQNLVFEKGDLWVATPTTNMMSQALQNLVNWSLRYSFSLSYNPVTRETSGSLATSGGWEQIYTQVSGLTTGTVYTFSFKFKNANGFAGSCRCQILSSAPVDNNNSSTEINGLNVTTSNSDEYKTFSVTFTATSSTAFIVFNFGYVGDGQTVMFRIKDIQLERRTFPSPFTQGTRGAGKCYLPFVLAQNTNFSISIFVRAVRGDGMVDVFCDDTDRWNGQLRCCINNNVMCTELLARTNNRGTSNNLYQPLTTNSADLKWHMYTLSSKAGQGTYLYQDGKQIGYYAGVYPQYTSLSVGRSGMGDASVFDGHFKDLVVTTTRYMTDAEILALWNRKMAQKDSLYIQGQLIENMVL